MEAKNFTPGKQIKDTEVIDATGNHWLVLRDIANALAQPREGAYYSRIVTPPPPGIVWFDLHPDDFYLEEGTVNEVTATRVRIKIKN